MPKISKEEKKFLDNAKKLCQYYGLYNGEKIITSSVYEKEISKALLDLIKSGLVEIEHNGSTYFVKDVL
jgi:hypothetical protein